MLLWVLSNQYDVCVILNFDLVMALFLIFKPPASFLQTMEEYVKEAPRYSTAARKDSVRSYHWSSLESEYDDALIGVEKDFLLFVLTLFFVSTTKYYFVGWGLGLVIGWWNRKKFCMHSLKTKNCLPIFTPVLMPSAEETTLKWLNNT